MTDEYELPDLICYRFTDPDVQPDWQINTRDRGEKQSIADRLWLLVRLYHYPVFPDLPIGTNTVEVTRYSPENGSPIAWRADALFGRSDRLWPCIRTSDPRLIRALVEMGIPPLSVGEVQL